MLLVAVLTPMSVQASGSFLPATGVRNQAMGGTGVAIAEDLTTLRENPAGLANLPLGEKRFSALLNYHLYYLRNSFQRTGNKPNESYPLAENTARYVKNIPNIYFGGNFGLKDFGASIGVYSPIGPGHEYSASGAQRYSMIINEISLFYVAAGAAYKIFDTLSLGASISFANVTAEQQIGFSLLPESRSLDGLLKVTGKDMMIPVGVFGLTWTPIPKLQVGLMYRTRYRVNLKGNAEASMPAIGLAGTDQLTVTQPIPELLQAGVGWSAQNWALETAVKWMRWGIYRQLKIDLKNNELGGVPIADIITPKKYRNTVSVHLGGSYTYKNQHTVRAGAFYDMGAIDPNNTTIVEYDPNKIGLTGGYMFRWNSFKFSLALMHMIYEKVEATHSVVRAIAPIGTGEIIGNGVYQWNVNTIGGAVQYDF